MTKYTGSEIVTEMLVQEGVPYAIGIPGHGNLALMDAFRRYQDRIKIIMPRHEQAAIHMADGYFRVKGEPLAVYTSIGAGASNTPIGLATAYVDSVPLLLLIGETHTYMRGVGVLQEIERQRWSDLYRVMEPVVKKSWHIDQARQLPRAVAGAFNAMRTGRPGPTLITLPMDVQADAVEFATGAFPNSQNYRPHDRPGGDPSAIEKAIQQLLSAKRPVIVAGGGVMLAGAEAELRELAEYLGAAVVTTMQAKSVFPESHPLYAWHMGTNATTCGNHMTRNADVLLAIGVRFADKATSSYVPGETFSIPPTKLLHVDIDPAEIGKNYPVDVGITGDAKAVLKQLLAAVKDKATTKDWQNAPYTQEIKDKVDEWLASFRSQQAASEKITMGYALAQLRSVLPNEGIVFTSSGNVQAQVYQEMPFELPRTYLSSGGFSTMGWAYPASLGAKLAAPETPVVALAGDGDFLMTFQELATAVQYNIPSVAVVLNNQGWQAIRDLQRIAFGDKTDYGTMFENNNQPISPHIADAARAFGTHAVRVEKPEQLAPALKTALEAGCPAVVEVMIDMEMGTSGGQGTGWWDVPVPDYFEEKHADYQHTQKEERI